MSPPNTSCLLTDLSSAEVRDHLSSDRRLIVPVGACDQYGPHLPIGAASLVAEAIACELARDFGVLRAPTLPYGVNVPGPNPYPGTASVREKTLHRVLTDLLICWEDQGFDEFILITAQLYDPHVEALATVTGAAARVRVIEALGIDFSRFLGGPAGMQHGGEVLTSLMLYLHPDKVNLALAHDWVTAQNAARPDANIERIPPGSPGSVGNPTRATAELGRLLYDHIVQRIRAKVFLTSPDAPD
jgi:creatinine amidohydrolase